MRDKLNFDQMYYFIVKWKMLNNSNFIENVILRLFSGSIKFGISKGTFKRNCKPDVI